MQNKHYYFLAVAEELNMSRAAEKCHVSHQGISNTIKQLEDEYGVVFFNRTPKLSLTIEGQRMTETLQRMRLLEENLINEFQDYKGTYEGTVRLGVMSSRYDLIVPELVASVKNKYPQIELIVEDHYSRELERKLLDGDLDLAIESNQDVEEKILRIPLYSERFYFICARNLIKKHITSDLEERIDTFQHGCKLSEFKDMPTVLYPPMSNLGRAIKAYAAENGFKFKTEFETNHLLTIDALCRKEMGAGIVTGMLLPRIQSNNGVNSSYVYAFPITDLDQYAATISLAYHKERYLSRIYKEIIDVIIENFANLQEKMPVFL